MKSNMRSKNQVYSVGNYLMTGKVLGKGHFARVEEATHRMIGKKVAIKIIDLTCIKEEYARRNLHREPRVMAKLRHPCIAALYETMMHGPRLYVVMEAAGGGDLCAYVLAARGARGARGLPESRAKPLAAQLVSAVRHMHARGVVHRDLKMENIMLDVSKQFIKIVDFGLSNTWSAGGGLRTPCGSLEYAAPELFLDGWRYGPEVDLWSIGVIVYGMVTGGLPFTGETAASAGAGAVERAAGAPESRSRPLLRAVIARGFTKKQKTALTCVSPECKTFIQHLLEPNVDLRMKIEEASRHRWVRRPGMRMRTHPLATVDPKANREIYRQIAELSGQSLLDVVAEIKANPFGSIAGVYNIKTHLHQTQAVPGVDLLWSSNTSEPRPQSPPSYPAQYQPDTGAASTSKMFTPLHNLPDKTQPFTPKLRQPTPVRQLESIQVTPRAEQKTAMQKPVELSKMTKPAQSPSFSAPRPISGTYGLKNPVYKIYENGDCRLESRLPSIDEHSNLEQSDAKKIVRKTTRAACVRKINLDEDRSLRLNSCPARYGDTKRTDYYKRGGDGLPSWRASGGALNTPPARILLQNNATTIKRASLGNIVSPHSSTNSHCKSERAMPVGWHSTRSVLNKDPPHLQRFRRPLPLK